VGVKLLGLAFAIHNLQIVLQDDVLRASEDVQLLHAQTISVKGIPCHLRNKNIRT
jgi:hypothetical protein